MDTWLDDDDSIGQHEASGASSSSSTSAALPDTRPVKGVQFMRKDSWLDMEDFARSTGKSSSRLTDPLTTLIGSIGPQNAEELVLSPLDFVTTLCEKEEAAFQQLVNNMQNLGFHSHFSGCNFDYMATMFIREALLHLGMSIPLPTYLHACDADRGESQLMLMASASKPPVKREEKYEDADRGVEPEKKKGNRGKPVAYDADVLRLALQNGASVELKGNGCFKL